MQRKVLEHVGNENGEPDPEKANTILILEFEGRSASEKIRCEQKVCKRLWCEVVG